MRDIDIDMFYDSHTEEYYCLRCSFRGKRGEVLKLNQQARYRYKALKLRVADFGEDNEPVSFKPHEGGAQ